MNVEEISEISNGSKHSSLADTHEEKARDVREITEETKSSNLKLIPEVSVHQKKEARSFPFLDLIKRREKKLTNKNLFVMQDPHSPAAEQYKILRARILSFSKENNMKTILITSCLPGEGKSTVSSNLSICIANGINEHALLIDCDLRKPAIHKFFGLSSSMGLSNYLREDIPLPQALNKTEVEKLTILPAGTSPDNPSELLSSKKMTDLIQEVKARYDDRYVIFDSTPVHQTPDPAILAEHIDGIILVVKAGKTNREVVARTVESLGKEKILGAVFNMSQEPIKSYYYNYNYYYSTQ
jgi:exopolysaccharide/PEP-CTERM locus tyrosine autokinase